MAVEGRSGGSDRGKPNPAAGFRVTRKRSRGSHSGISFTTAFTVIVTVSDASVAGGIISLTLQCFALFWGFYNRT
eukprot:486953-Amorphochlora_amoeboformis.AAC.1